MALMLGATVTDCRAEPVPVVVDGVGRVVGPLLSQGNVVLTVGGQVVVTGVGPDGFNGSGVYTARYTDAACAGPGYVQAFGLPLPAYQAGADFVVPAPGQAVMTLGYRKDFFGSNPPGNCVAETATMRVGPAVRTPMQSLGFQSPFTVQMR